LVTSAGLGLNVAELIVGAVFKMVMVLEDTLAPFIVPSFGVAEQ
jgi:hypothetical protein